MSNQNKTELYPLIPLRNMTVFPHMMIHFDVGRPASVAALGEAMSGEQKICLFTQTDENVEQPGKSEIEKVGVIAQIRQVMNLPGSNLRVLAEGLNRAVLRDVQEGEHCLMAQVRVPLDTARMDTAMKAMKRFALDLLRDYAKLTGKVSDDFLASMRSITAPGKIADVIAANILVDLEDRQGILNELRPYHRLDRLCAIMERETELTELENKIQSRLKDQVDKNQKDYYLREQLRVIQDELGDKDPSETSDLYERIEKTPLSDEAREKLLKELNHISHMAPGMPEISVARSWVESVLDMPWGVESRDDLDLRRARRILNRDHYGMDKVKDRVIEYLAVRQRMAKGDKDLAKAPILCFVGPPGVGKTSIVKAIAQAMGRKYVRMSLGGIRDEAEIRGHRRTYVGAMPGRIITGIRQAGSMNPVFLFDEIDKMASDFRGDPASAMLEVLDGEQNHAFRDHYMDMAFDLSKVMFIATANVQDTIPPALQDRMEIIEVPSYTEEEKLHIAVKHLLPKQLEEHGVGPKEVTVPSAVMKKLIENYTREAGVRQLERVIGSVVRKAVVDMSEHQLSSVSVTPELLEKYLGGAVYLRQVPEKKPMVGIVNGLAYTTVGGETLTVECARMEGSGKLTLTGQLGDVMKESASAAMSLIRANHERWGISKDLFKDTDLHIHVPEGAVPKDGPSAGVTIFTAMVSALSEKPVKQNVAMTGEITLRGRVLPIGGVKEKLLAAYRAGITDIILPVENKKDLEDIPPKVLKTFDLTFAGEADDVLRRALTNK